jgi:hypothetical protein
LKKTSELLKVDLNQIINSEHEKIKSNLETYCSKCHNNKKNNKCISYNQFNDNDTVKFYDLKLNSLIVNNNVNPELKFYGVHLICHNCLLEYENDILGIDGKIVKEIKNVKKDINLNFFCKVCHMDHNTT